MTAACPQCDAVGKTVHADTVAAQSATPPSPADLEGWRFCGSKPCAVVYYRGDTTLGLTEVRSVPFQKSDDPERLVCFCFGHTVAEVEADAGQDGVSAIRDEIKRRCKAGEDDCRTRNPQGRCCLGNVGSVIKVPAAKKEPCCDTGCGTSEERSDEVPSDSSRSRDRVGFGAAIGLAAISSACCWVPAAGFLLGVSTAGVGAAFAPWRVPALVLSLVFLLGALVLRHRARRRACEAGNCDPAAPGAWLVPGVVGAVVVMLGLYPVYASTDGTAQPPTDEPSAVLAPAVHVTYSIEGMTCGGCEGHVETAFADIEGVASVDASYRDGAVVVGWVGELDLAAIDNALAELGYVRSDADDRP